MTIDTLTGFFMWCSIISVGVYLLWVVFFLLMPDFVYSVPHVPAPGETLASTRRQIFLGPLLV